MKKVGLTLGKFAPLHKGHQYLIETALKETDHLIIVIYDAIEVTSIPLIVRAGWIRKLYPQAEVIEGVKGPTVMGDTPEIKKIQEDYILNLLNGRKVTHFYSSEFYGEHMSIALGALNRVVDQTRSHIPVSGTIIRENTFLNRQYLNPVVYRDHVTNIVFLGAPSTGKTTIAETLAEEYATCMMPEYGREYWEQHQVNRRLNQEQLLQIAEGHILRENELLFHADRYLFTDTNAITTFMFAHYYHGYVSAELIKLAKSAEKRYDIIFVCDTDIPYDDTWDRSGDVSRNNFQKQILEDLESRNLKYILIKGTLTERIDTVRSVLRTFNKY